MSATAMAEFDALGEIAERGPKHAYIESTDRCNTRRLYCAHCHADFGAGQLPNQRFDIPVGPHLG